MRTGVAGFQSERLKQLRLAFGMTQTTLGRDGGARLWQRFKMGEWASGPRGRRLPAAYAKFSGSAKTGYLRNSSQLARTLHFSFDRRSALRPAPREIAEVRLEWLQEISYKLQESLEFIEVNVPHLEEHNCELISDEEMEQMASKCRQTWGLGIAPILQCRSRIWRVRVLSVLGPHSGT